MAKTAKAAVEVKSIADLRQELDDKYKALVDYRRHHAAGELANTRVISQTRKEIARLSTAINAAKDTTGKQAPKEDK